MTQTSILNNQSEIILRNENKIASFRFTQEGKIVKSRYYFDAKISTRADYVTEDEVVVGYDAQIYQVALLVG